MLLNAIQLAPHRRDSARPALRAGLVWCLVLALLCSHWQGLAHRIAHAARALPVSEAMAGSSAADNSAVDSSTVDRSADKRSAGAPADQPGAGHACLAFDAASVGAFLCGAPFVADLVRSHGVLAAWTAFISYLAPLARHFASRAPPAS